MIWVEVFENLYVIPNSLRPAVATAEACVALVESQGGSNTRYLATTCKVFVPTNSSHRTTEGWGSVVIAA